MSWQPQDVDNLMVSSNFIRAVRELGYLSLSAALAELVDNSLQADATSVAISLHRPEGATHPEIGVLDNGSGMNRRELEQCLRFGGSSRFGMRESFGRFGMGLPAASLSQACRVEVVAWQDSASALEVTLDVNAITSGEVPALKARNVGSSVTSSGCRVTWRDCDRIEYRRLGWLERTLRRDFGRMYRRYLTDGLTLTLNGTAIEADDPLMLATKVEGASATVAFDPMEYELHTADGGSACVRVRFTYLPVHRWHGLDNPTKRRLGIVGGGGVSILRAGREIAHGWHLMGGKRKENYDDWWRCEIEFEPVLDEHFGITINKQGIRPSAKLREALEPELESIARLLNVRVRKAFEDVKFQAEAQASCRIAEAADPDQPVLRNGRGRGAHGPLRYRISTTRLSSGAMFKTTLAANKLDVQLNVDHPAFTSLYQPLQTLTDNAATELRTAVELLILAFARSAEASADPTDPLVAEWGSTYARMLQKS
ncbi:ATP-binding protein [Saxibacter everestensis]|uniref:ATP-binding protein n=1 Tax=Saxibacter everestensis TaxID=2909229 RepID=A0ABY8QXQ8_9MICO|nr:ATP-binding protein [Brevibacteriaceae bacterium ZFBP1038]